MVEERTTAELVAAVWVAEAEESTLLELEVAEALLAEEVVGVVWATVLLVFDGLL